MQLGKFTDYGLRILMHLAVTEEARLPTVRIAAVFGISEHHLAKVASALVHAGFVTSGRGRVGGLSLARDPEEISVGAVARALTGETPVVECFATGAPECRILPACGLRAPLAEAQEAFFAVLDRYTLADMTRRRSALQTLLTAV